MFYSPILNVLVDLLVFIIFCCCCCCWSLLLLRFIITHHRWRWIPPAVDLPLYFFFAFQTLRFPCYKSCITSCYHSHIRVRLVGKNYYTFSMVSHYNAIRLWCGVPYWRRKQISNIWMIRCALCVVFLQIPSVIGLETSHSNNQIELIGYRRIEIYYYAIQIVFVCVPLLAVFIS